MTVEREILSWDEFGTASRELAKTVWDSGYHPDIIVCVARGGLLPAGSIGYALDIKSLLVLNVEFYTGIGTTLEDPHLIAPVPDQDGMSGMSGKKILIVDDVADSGRTLKFVHELCSQYADEIRTAVLYEKPRTVLHCDYVWKETDKWIAFPWSALPPVNEKANSEA